MDETRGPRRDEAPRAGAVTVLVVDDSPAYLSALGEVVAATEGFVVVGEATSGERAVEMAAAMAPDLVLMDVRMPGLGGIAAGERIASRGAGTVVVLLSSADEKQMPRALGPGAAPMLDKRRVSPRTLAALWYAHRPRAGGRATAR